MKYKNILLSNDDGYDSLGLEIVEKYFKSLGSHTTIIAPLKQQSGTSSAITIFGKLRLEKKSENLFVVDGSPVDCVKIGLKNILKSKPELVVSGINKGDNTGQSVFYSGTVGAAFEGARQGIDSVAFSFFTNCDRTVEFNENALFMMIKEFFENHYIGGFVSVNFPNCDYSNFKGFKKVEISTSNYIEKYEEIEPTVFEVTLDYFEESENSETYLLKENWATISPMKTNWTDYSKL